MHERTRHMACARHFECSYQGEVRIESSTHIIRSLSPPVKRVKESTDVVKERTDSLQDGLN